MIKWFKNNLAQNKKILFIFPYFLFFVLFVLVPLIFILVTTFIPIQNSSDSYNPTEVIGSYSFWSSFGKSILVGFFSAIICLFISLPYVYFIYTSKNKIFQFVALSFLLAPLLLFTIVKILSIRSFFSFVFDERTLNNVFFLTLGLVYLNLPFMVIPLYSVFSHMPKSLINASKDLGYTEFGTFVRVVIPYCLQAICSGITIVFIMSVMSVSVSDKLLINSEQNQMIGNIINDLVNPSNPFDMQKASSVIFVVIIFLSIIYVMINSIPKIYRKIKGGIDG